MASAPQIRETHSGLVVLVGDRAYKTKKAVVTDFLDFSTAALREKACAREVELNRRLAAEAYLGVAHFQGPGSAEPEPVIVMRRYPDSARLSQRLDGAEVTAELCSIAAVLARFHATAVRGPEIDRQATAAAVTGRWDDNLDEMTAFVPDLLPAATLTEIDALAHSYLRCCGELFEDRIADGRIVDGHADLLADDIFWSAAGPVLLDCLDFDDDLRYVDGLDDAAFLAMDLEFLGHAGLAVRYLSEYRTWAQDPAPQSLADFYLAYRALVRAKVECIRSRQGDPDSAAAARRHLDIVVAHLRAARPRLVLVGGGPGTGKTTLSRALAEHIGAEVISTDEVRRDLRAAGLLDGPVGAVGDGLYAADKVAAVYRTVLDRAEAALARGASVVLDGTWREPANRAAAAALADRTGASLRQLRCTLPLTAAQQRIAARVGGASDATVEVAAALADGDWADMQPIDTSGPIAGVIAEVGRTATAVTGNETPQVRSRKGKEVNDVHTH